MRFCKLEKPSFSKRAIKTLNVMGIPLQVAVPSEQEMVKYEEQGCTKADLLIIRTDELNRAFPNNPYQMLIKAVEATRDTFRWHNRTDCGPVRKMRGSKTPVKMEQFKHLKEVFDQRLWSSATTLIDRTLSLADFQSMLQRAILYLEDSHKEEVKQHPLHLPYCIEPVTGQESEHPLLDCSFIYTLDWFMAWNNFLSSLTSQSAIGEAFQSDVLYNHEFCLAFVLAYATPEDAQEEYTEEQQQEKEQEEVLDPVVYPEGVHMLETMSGQEQQFFRVKATATVLFSMQFSFSKHYLEHYVDIFNATLAPAGVKVRVTDANFATVEFDRIEVCDGYPTRTSMNFETMSEKAALVDLIYKVLVDMHQKNRIYQDVMRTGNAEHLLGQEGQF